MAAAVQPSATLKTPVRIPKGNTRRRCGSRRPAVPVAGRAATGMRCLVPCFPTCYDSGQKNLRGQDTPPIHRWYRWWREMLKGAVAGTSPTGPWTDGGTGVRTPDDDDCQSMAHTTRPSMPLVPFSAKMLQSPQGLSLREERNS